MDVDKFGRNGDSVYTGINIANLTNSFLRRDGGNTAITATEMNSNIIKNVADPLSNQDVATKNYVDKNAMTTAGGVVFGDKKLNVVSNLKRYLGCSQPIDLHLVKNEKSPVDKFDAVNKACADRIKYKTAIGNIRNTVMTDHTLFTFLDAKAFSSEKIMICEMWVERLANELLATSSPMFSTAWPGFYQFPEVRPL